MRHFRRVGAFVAVIVSMTAASPVGAVTDVHPDSDPGNPAFAAYLGSGIYFNNGREAFILRAPIRFGVRSAQEHAFGVRVRLNATLGFYNLDPGDLGSLFLPDNIGTFSIIPGVEFPIKIFDNWTLAPFLDVGTAYNDATEDWVGVLGTGAFSRLEFFREKKQKYLLWNDLIYGNNLNTEQRFDDFLLFRSDLEIRKLVGFRAGQVQNDLGLLIRSEIYFSEVVFARANMEPLVTRKRWEVGLTVGPTERFKFLKNLIPVPRIGLSYRFGDGARTIRLVIRSRF